MKRFVPHTGIKNDYLPLCKKNWSPTRGAEKRANAHRADGKKRSTEGKGVSRKKQRRRRKEYFRPPERFLD